jgi:hypothetical protein
LVWKKQHVPLLQAHLKEIQSIHHQLPEIQKAISTYRNTIFDENVCSFLDSLVTRLGWIASLLQRKPPGSGVVQMFKIG